MDRITKSFLEEFSKVKMTRYDTHLYKLKDSIYKALKYLSTKKTYLLDNLLLNNVRLK